MSSLGVISLSQDHYLAPKFHTTIWGSVATPWPKSFASWNLWHCVWKDHKTADIIGALHTGPWIRIRCGTRIQIQRPLCLHTASVRIRAPCCVAWQCVRSMSSSAMRVACVPFRSARKTTLNPDPVNLVSVPVWRAPQFCIVHPLCTGVDRDVVQSTAKRKRWAEHLQSAHSNRLLP